VTQPAVLLDKTQKVLKSTGRHFTRAQVLDLNRINPCCPRTMPVATLAVRNVFIYDGTRQPPLLVAGCRQFGRMTNAELYSCVAICFEQPRPHQFRLSDGTNILPNDDALLPIGQYFVVSPGMALSDCPLTANKRRGPSVVHSRCFIERGASPEGHFARQPSVTSGPALPCCHVIYL